MQERDRRSFLRFFFIFDSSLTFVNDSDFVGRVLWLFLQRKPEKLTLDGASNDADLKEDIFSRWMSLSVCDVFSDCAKTSLIKSGWLFSKDKDEVLCLIKVSCLHALAWGNEFGRIAKELCLLIWYVPPERSSRNSSSSDELIRSSASEDCRESDWVDK